MSHDNRRGILWALVASLGIAGFVIPWKMASSYGATTATNTLVLLTAAAVFNTLLTVFQRRSLPSFSRLDLTVAAALALFTLFGNLASAAAIQLISPALLTVMQRIEVIVIALFAWPFIGERIDSKFWAGAAIAICGLVVLQDPFGGTAAGALESSRTTGMLWAVASMLCFSAMAVITRKYIHRIDPVSVNALRLWLSVAFWFLLKGFPAELYAITWPQAGYAILAAFFGPFLGRLSMMMSAKYVEARITTLATLVAPVLTLGLGYVLLSDLPTTREMQGGAIMLIGISIPILGLARPKRPALPDADRVLRES
jgi:drug/metabolite transporter (DMT)-like permease